MRVLEQRIVESGEASVSNASMVEMQQVVLSYFHLMLTIVMIAISPTVFTPLHAVTDSEEINDPVQ